MSLIKASIGTFYLRKVSKLQTDLTLLPSVLTSYGQAADV